MQKAQWERMGDGRSAVVGHRGTGLLQGGWLFWVGVTLLPSALGQHADIKA